jgi:uracil-DNA glycosylase
MTAMCDTLSDGWRRALEPVFATPEAHRLRDMLRAQEEAGRRIFPPADQRLAALNATPLETVKVVILGQDPYHGFGQANGLAFSVTRETRIPPSLRNIYKELESDLGLPPPAHGDLSAWARQGVLLLNNALTVEEGKAGSHKNAGWDRITDAAIAAVAARSSPCVFLLWGSHAQSKVSRVLQSPEIYHLILNARHPSPLSAHNGFFGCRHFSKANAFLTQWGIDPIDWIIGI